MEQLFYCIRNKHEVNPFLEKLGTFDQMGDVVVVALKDHTLEDIEIPELIEECVVSEIGKEAFLNTSLKRIVLPSSILVVGENAFPKEASIIYNGIEYDSYSIVYEVKRKYNEMLNEQIDGVVEAVYQQEEIINIVKSCRTMDEVFERVQDRFGLSELQTKTILDIPLSLLSQLDVSQLEALKIEMDN